MEPKGKEASRIYLDEYVLQKDMRIRMPKEIIKNLSVVPGMSFFEVYLDPKRNEIILSVKKAVSEEE